MKETGVIFTADSIRAILEGRKTQTRRIVSANAVRLPNGAPFLVEAPYGVPGDRIWCKETLEHSEDGRWCYRANPSSDLPVYRNTPFEQMKWLVSRKKPVCPSVHMPRWASRLTLELTEVRVQRLQDISKEDAIAEGIAVFPLQSADDPSAWYQSSPGVHQERSAQISYAALWDSLNAKRGYPWDSNPWVWAYTFKRKTSMNSISHKSDVSA